MNLFQRAARKLYRSLRGTPPTDEQITEQLVGLIRQGGGTVGENVHIIASGIDMGEPYYLSIGDNVSITGARILTHDASLKKTLGYTKTGRVHIGSDVFIGWGAIILPNTVIGDRVVIGAGTVVAKDIPSNSVVVGNPARIICTYDEYVEKIKADMEHKPVINLFPDEILGDEESRRRLIESGNGYIR